MFALLTAGFPRTRDLDQHQNMLLGNASAFIVSITIMTGYAAIQQATATGLSDLLLDELSKVFGIIRPNS